MRSLDTKKKSSDSFFGPTPFLWTYPRQSERLNQGYDGSGACEFRQGRTNTALPELEYSVPARITPPSRLLNAHYRGRPREHVVSQSSALTEQRQVGGHIDATPVITQTRRLGPLWYDPDRFDQRDVRRIRWLSDFVEHVVVPYHRADVQGLERIPQGPGLFVANHNAGLLTIDSFIFCAAVCLTRGIRDLPFILTHDRLAYNPLFNQLFVPLGAVRAHPNNAEQLFERGHKVLDYPGGEIDAMRPFRERHRIKFAGRTGYARLAIKHSVPVIPVVAAGAHSTFLVIDDLPWLASFLRVDQLFRIRCWPLTLSLPWGLTLGPPPPHIPLPSRIRIEILNPIHFERSGEEASHNNQYVKRCGSRVEQTMQEALTSLTSR